MDGYLSTPMLAAPSMAWHRRGVHARRGYPFTLHLTGPAGGTYTRSTDTPGETLEIDAIDWCRILSGRGTPVGVLHHPLLL